MHARHFSPLTGRFLSNDPEPGWAQEPQSWNRYAYVLGSPISLTDPTGMVPIMPPRLGIPCGRWDPISQRYYGCTTVRPPTPTPRPPPPLPPGGSGNPRGGDTPGNTGGGRDREPPETPTPTPEPIRRQPPTTLPGLYNLCGDMQPGRWPLRFWDEIRFDPWAYPDRYDNWLASFGDECRRESTVNSSRCSAPGRGNLAAPPGWCVCCRNPNLPTPTPTPRGRR